MKVLMSNGMGVESATILTRWLDDPDSRDFELSDLTVITAMTGKEWRSTARLNERHILPRLREAGVRYVQVARAGRSEADGIVVLSDTRAPDRLHMEGAYTIIDEYMEGGSIPSKGGRHVCAMHFKGFVIDTWAEQEYRGEPFRHIIGFNAGEVNRASRDGCYGTGGREGEYPLVRWGLGREACEVFLFARYGERWEKSACTFCPYSKFQGGLPVAITRYREEPDQARLDLAMEYVALCFNPRMRLYERKSLLESLGADHNVEALAALAEELAAAEWAIWRVRRIYSGPGRAERKTQVTEFHGSHAEMVAALESVTERKPVFDTSYRSPIIERGSGYPAVEEFYVVAPVLIAGRLVKPMCRHPHAFEARWSAAMVSSLGGADVE